MRCIVVPQKRPKVTLGEFIVPEPELDIHLSTEFSHKHARLSAYRDKAFQVGNTFGSGAVNYRSVGIHDDRGVPLERQFAHKLSFHNYTNKRVIITPRIGLPALILPDLRKSGYESGCVVITSEMVFTNDEYAESAHKELVALGKIYCPRLEKIEPLLVKDKWSRFGRSIMIDYVIPEHELESVEQQIYHQATDTLLTIKDGPKKPIHPFSGQAVPDTVDLLEAFDTNRNDLTVTFRYINPKLEAQPKYFRLGNRTLVLRPESGAPERSVLVGRSDHKTKQTVSISAEYIEVLYSIRSEKNVPYDSGHYCTRVNVEDAETYYGIYSSAIEAENPKETIEAKHRNLKDKIDLLEVEHKRQQQLNDDRVRLVEKKLVDKINEHESLKKERVLVKEKHVDKREDDMHRKRMWMEGIKIGGALATTGLGLYLLYLKSKK
jgi:hypothetical protein